MYILLYTLGSPHFLNLGFLHFLVSFLQNLAFSFFVFLLFFFWILPSKYSACKVYKNWILKKEQYPKSLSLTFFFFAFECRPFDSWRVLVRARRRHSLRVRSWRRIQTRYGNFNVSSLFFFITFFPFFPGKVRVEYAVLLCIFPADFPD